MGCMGPELPIYTISRPFHLFSNVEVACSACDIMQIFRDKQHRRYRVSKSVSNVKWRD